MDDRKGMHASVREPEARINPTRRGIGQWATGEKLWERDPRDGNTLAQPSTRRETREGKRNRGSRVG